jgi:serine/threonine protein kinase/Tol biopolymer transport system component
MDRERWQQIDQIFEAALARPASERAAFLGEACAGDAELRAEIESLIAHEEAEGFMEAPAFEDAARVLAADARHSLIGQTLGSYQILESLGAGGMGEVYLALHVRTNRKVALKLLPAAFMKDQQRVRRFQQEARTVLALNHPNIVTVYDIEQVDDTHLIATEVIEGETLRQRMKRAPLRLSEALDIGIQVAGALAAAHGAGVVHRDIKPDNIMLRPDGFVKVLDFGLAKLTEKQVLASSELPTRAMIKTDAGMVMGTANYMSPEQARGLEVDSRTDIFSFGVVLYEMLTGNMPFAGETKSDVMAAILQIEPPPLARYWPEAPEALEWIVTKTLTKEKDERYQTAKELLTDLKRLKRRSDYDVEAARIVSTPSGGSVSVAQSGEALANITAAQSVPSTAGAMHGMSSAEYVVSEIKRHRRGIIFVFVGLGVFAALMTTGIIFGLRYMRQREAATRTSSQPFSEMKVTRLTTTGNASHAAISPDGKYVVHVTGGVGQQSLQLRHIATGSDKEIVPPSRENYSALTFSHDGSYIYYAKYSDEEGGVVSQVPVLGGTPKVLGKDMDGAPTFSPDGKQFAFIRGLPVESEAALMIGSVDGGGERRLVTQKARDLFARASINAWGPAWSPDGELIAFALRTSEANADRYWRVMLARVKDGTQTPLTFDKWSAIGQIAWLPNGSGMIIAAAEQDPGAPHQLWHVSYPGGAARRFTNDLNNYDGVRLTGDATALVTVQSEQRANIWVAANGEASRAAQIPSERNDGLSGLAWTPDGRVVYTSTAGGNADIWIMAADGNNRKKLTFSDSADFAPAVSSDGRYIVFVSNRAGAYHIWRMDADGGNPKQLTKGSYDVAPSCSPDSQWVIYSSEASGRRQLWKVLIDGGAPAQLTDYNAGLPVVSPDGKFIACSYIDERETPRRYRTAVIPFTGGRPLQAFDFPRSFQQVVGWTPDSRTLTYLVTSGGVSNIWRQTLDGGEPTQLTDFKDETIFRYDWSRDGKHLALARGTVISDVVLVTAVR